MFLLDTNVLSELVKRFPSPAVLAEFHSNFKDELFTSAICVEEIRFGAAIAQEGNQIWKQMRSRVLQRVQVLVFDNRTAIVAGDLRAEWKKRGIPVGRSDGLIAATAKTHGLTLVTRNVRHFDHVAGLRVENWFEPPPPSAETGG